MTPERLREIIAATGRDRRELARMLGYKSETSLRQCEAGKIVSAALRIGLGLKSEPLRHQVERLARHLDEIGDRFQSASLREMLNPTREPDFTPIVQS